MLSAPVPAASWVPSTVLVGAAWRRGKSVSQEPGLGRAGARRQVWRVWLKTREQDPCSPVTRAEVDGGRGQEVGAWAVLSSCRGGGIQERSEFLVEQGHP